MVPVTALAAVPAAPVRPTARRPLDVRAVTLHDGMLGAWQRLNREATIPHCIERLETSGVLDNLRRLTGDSDAAFRGPLFADSDLYKVLEAIGWEVVRGDVIEFEDFLDESVRLLAAVQAPDGYLNSYYQGPHTGERFTDLAQGHELYCLGHLVQAGIAWSYAGRTELLEIALRAVELVHATFGPGGRDEVCGHPEIETALVELSRVTGDPRHRELARRMIELRGSGRVGEGMFGGAYYQDLVPVKDAREATGHAVRQLYLLAGVADVELDDPVSGYGESLDALWTSIHTQKMYVTGGLGSRHRGEAFGDPYELPPDRAYAETCAAIANLHWNWRMLLLHGDAKYADEMERGLYNAIAVSTAMNGKAFFYSNPLQLRAGHSHEEDAPSTRLDWYACACCPPNLARLLSSLSGYVLTETDDAVQFQLYAAGRYDLGDGSHADVRTDYPWDGSVRIELDAPSSRRIELRVPGWATGARLRVDGEDLETGALAGYVAAPAGASVIELELPIRPVFEKAHPWVDAVRGCVALRRGPVYYCLESADLPAGVELQDVLIPEDSAARDSTHHPELGVPMVELPVVRRRRPDPLYAAVRESAAEVEMIERLTAIPYFRWANRTPGPMRVWIPTT
jgi:uncharacterized protein